MQRPASWTRRRSNAARRLAAIAVIGAAGTIAGHRRHRGGVRKGSPGVRAGDAPVLEHLQQGRQGRLDVRQRGHQAVREAEPRDQGRLGRLSVRGPAAEVPGHIGRGRPAGSDALGHPWVPQLAAQGVVAERRQPAGVRRRSRRTRCPARSRRPMSRPGRSPATTRSRTTPTPRRCSGTRRDFAAAGISGPPKTLSQMYADAAKLTDPSQAAVRPRGRRHRHLEHGAVHLERRRLVHEQRVTPRRPGS